MYKFKVTNFFKIVKYWLPPIIWGTLIFSVSSGGVPKVSPVYWQDFVAHKTGHIIEYAILAILIYRALIQGRISKVGALFLAILICGIYGFTDEFHQVFTPGREPKLRDVVIDIIGATGGVFIVWKLLPKAPKKLLTWGEKLDLL